MKCPLLPAGRCLATVEDDESDDRVRSARPGAGNEGARGSDPGHVWAAQVVRGRTDPWRDRSTDAPMEGALRAARLRRVTGSTAATAFTNSSLARSRAAEAPASEWQGQAGEEAAWTDNVSREVRELRFMLRCKYLWDFEILGSLTSQSNALLPTDAGSVKDAVRKPYARQRHPQGKRLRKANGRCGCFKSLVGPSTTIDVPSPEHARRDGYAGATSKAL